MKTSRTPLERKPPLAVLLSLAVLLCLALPLPAAALPAGFVVEPVMQGLALPINLAFAPDGRIFFNELKTGNVRIIKDGRLLEAPFFHLGVYDDGERGLIGLALAPGFPGTPWVYVYYTARVQQPQPHAENRLARLRADGDTGSALEVLLALPTNQTSPIHNGGELVFGPDRKLYVTVGDARLQDSAPSLDSLVGKILRLELDGTGAAGNPFGSGDTIRGRIWSRGHRNHVGLAFHPVTGGLYQTENGPTEEDEINHVVKGGNYGWPTCSGPCNPPAPGLVQPLRSYTPTIAPTGIGFLGADRYPPDYAGDLVFGDYKAGRLRRIDFDPDTPDQILAVDDRFLELRPLLTEPNDPEEHRLAVLDVTTGPDGFLWFSVGDFFDDTPNLAGIYRLRHEDPFTEVPAAGPGLGLLGLAFGLRRPWARARRKPPSSPSQTAEPGVL